MIVMNSVPISKFESLARGLKLLARYAPEDINQAATTETFAFVVRIKSIYGMTKTHCEQLKRLGWLQDMDEENCWRWGV